MFNPSGETSSPEPPAKCLYQGAGEEGGGWKRLTLPGAGLVRKFIRCPRASREKNLCFSTNWYNLSSPPRSWGTSCEEPDGTGRTREPAPGAAGASHAGGTSLGMRPLRDLPGRLCGVPRALRDQHLPEPGRGSCPGAGHHVCVAVQGQHHTAAPGSEQEAAAHGRAPDTGGRCPSCTSPLQGPAGELQVRLRGCRGDAGASAKPCPEGQPHFSV